MPIRISSHALALGAIVLIASTAPLAPAADTAMPPVPGADAIERAVLATNDAMIEAANRLDLDTFFSYVIDADRGLIVQNGVIFPSRQAAKDAVARGLVGVTKIDRRFINPQVTVLSADTALLVSEGTVTATLQDGRTMDSRFAVSLVWVKRPEGWRLLHGHYSMPVTR